MTLPPDAPADPQNSGACTDDLQGNRASIPPNATYTLPNLLWIGAADGMEEALVRRAGIKYHGIQTGQLRGMNLLTILKNAGKMITGFFESLALTRTFQPAVCLVTGGYVCTPVVLACRLRWRNPIPVIIYLPDMMPGWAIRTLSRLAQRVAVSFPEVTVHFGGAWPQGKAVVTGYPVRADLLKAVGGGKLDAAAHAQNRSKVRRQLAQKLQRPLDQTNEQAAPLPLILVWGGSQGSRTINEATWAALPKVLPHAHLVHVVGNRDWSLWQEKIAQLSALVPADLVERYHPAAYLHEEMALALAAADITVARAGASSLGEFPVARLPAVLVPYPGVNQMQNAEYLAQRGAALIIQDDRLQAELGETLVLLLQDQPKRQAMTAAMAQLAQPDAALHIGQQLVQVGSRQ